jgi:arabinose-5-phosphate isomerase
VAITGIGKSGLVGRKIAATLSSTGTPAFFLHPVEGAHGDLGAVRDGDVVIAISYSGRTEELNAILPAVRSLGAAIIAITSGLHSPLAELADIVIDAGIPREACSINMVPTSSTTAALALGDALAVCLMDAKSFTRKDFGRYHPGGVLGQRLCLSVADLMHRDNIPLAGDSDSLRTSLAMLDSGGFGAVILTGRDGRLSGILTDGDLRRVLCRGNADLDQPVKSAMTVRPRHARPDMSAAELVDIMEQSGITVLPVVDEDLVVVGIVHLHDLLGKGQIQFATGGGK